MTRERLSHPATRAFYLSLVDEAVVAHYGRAKDRNSDEWVKMEETVNTVLSCMKRPSDYMVHCAEGLSDFTLMEGTHNDNTKAGRMAEFKMCWSVMLDVLMNNSAPPEK